MRARERAGCGRGWSAVAGAALVLSMAGCAGAGSSPAVPPSAGPTVTVTEGTRTSTRSVTVIGEAPIGPAAEQPPATQEPAPVVADCPYLSDDAVADINGQRTGVTTVVDVQPHPICTFTRSDGGWLATVRIVQADTPAAAAAAVDQHVPVDRSNPAADPPGWSGGSMSTADGSIYAVSKGNIAVIAEANQPQSIKGRQLATAAITNLGL